jgi:hypothetical protein
MTHITSQATTCATRRLGRPALAGRTWCLRALLAIACAGVAVIAAQAQAQAQSASLQFSPIQIAGAEVSQRELQDQAAKGMPGLALAPQGLVTPMVRLWDEIGGSRSTPNQGSVTNTTRVLQ